MSSTATTRRLLPRMIRKLARRAARRAVRNGPRFVSQAAIRVPFSRFHRVASHLFWGEEVIEWRGVSIKVNPGEIHGYYPYVVGDYAGEEIDELIELCEGATVFADVGANVGMVSLALAAARPGLEIFAFEPDANVADRFSQNLRLNPAHSPGIKLTRAAVAEVNGELSFTPSPDESNAEVGRLTAAGEGTPLTHSVPAVRLDTFFLSQNKLPDVVKIDVEGGELQALRGMAGLFERGYPKVMLIEVHGFYFGKDSAEFKKAVGAALSDAGYDLRRLTGEGGAGCGAAEQWPERLHVLAVRADR